MLGKFLFSNKNNNISQQLREIKSVLRPNYSPANILYIKEGAASRKQAAYTVCFPFKAQTRPALKN